MVYFFVIWVFKYLKLGKQLGVAQARGGKLAGQGGAEEEGDQHLQPLQYHHISPI